LTNGPRVLILSASIGEGHDLPARMIRDGIAEHAAEASVSIRDGLDAMGSFVARVIGQEAPLQRPGLRWLFDLEYWALTRFAPIRRLAGSIGVAIGGRGLLRVIEAERPDVIVSTYPGVTEVLGRLRGARRLNVPVCSAITDLAALHFWAQRDVDLHLVTHDESIEEVHSIAPRSRVVWARGMTSPDFERPRGQTDARVQLELPAMGVVVLVSGGGWGVGDVEGAVDAALAAADVAAVLVLCGRNERLRARIEARQDRDARVRALGFTTSMSDLLAAADVLVHSTAGLTVLEAWIRGCRPISYGWGVAHIRANNEAFQRFGIADVVADREQLQPAIERAAKAPRRPFDGYGRLPSAAALVLELATQPDRDGARAA
jgi:UDP-N-acetylglucosamine:LPS N-acetylglucosamine transferase